MKLNMKITAQRAPKSLTAVLMNARSSAVCTSKGRWVCQLTGQRGLAVWLSSVNVVYSSPELPALKWSSFWNIFKFWDTFFHCAENVISWRAFLLYSLNWTIQFRLTCYHTFTKGAYVTWEWLVGAENWKRAEGDLRHPEPQSASFLAVVLQHQRAFWTPGHLLWNCSCSWHLDPITWPGYA